MKFSHLKQIAFYLQQFKTITVAYRINDTTIKLVFDGNETLYFDLKKSNAFIYKSHDLLRSKVYNAPFDTVLGKIFNRSSLENVQLHNDDKLLRFTCVQKKSYKSITATLQLEFTGKNTNAIILDEKSTVLEALRHISLSFSFREVQPGVTLLEPPKPNFTFQEYPLEDINRYLFEAYDAHIHSQLKTIKAQKSALLQKKLLSLKEKLSTMEEVEVLQRDYATTLHHANVILANLHTIKGYEKELTLKEYDGSTLTLTLPKLFKTPSMISTYYFNRAKKIKNRIENSTIERDTLNEKIKGLEHFLHALEQANTLSDIAILFPPKEKKQKKHSKTDPYEVFYIEGYKVLLGKNEKENIAVLKASKAKDVWLHIQEKPSSHVIIKTDKKEVPAAILEKAAKLCVDFSVFEKGDFLVDYTHRCFVKIQNGANVYYNNFKTIVVRKE